MHTPSYKQSHKRFYEKQITTIKWPAHCPDFSLIEPCWKLMKDIVYDGPSFKTKAALWQKIKKCIINFKSHKKDVLRRNLVEKYLTMIQNNDNN